MVVFFGNIVVMPREANDLKLALAFYLKSSGVTGKRRKRVLMEYKAIRDFEKREKMDKRSVK